MAQPVRSQGPNRPQHQVHQLRVSRRNIRRQKRSPPQIQSRPQKNPSPHPWRPPYLRIAHHPRIHRPGLGLRARSPPLRPLRPGRSPILGRLCRAVASVAKGGFNGGRRRRGEGIGGGGSGSGAGSVRGSLREVQQGEKILRRRRDRISGHCAWELPELDQSRADPAECELDRRIEDSEPVRVGPALRRRRRRQGRLPRH